MARGIGKVHCSSPWAGAAKTSCRTGWPDSVDVELARERESTWIDATTSSCRVCLPYGSLHFGGVPRIFGPNPGSAPVLCRAAWREQRAVGSEPRDGLRFPLRSVLTPQSYSPDIIV